MGKIDPAPTADLSSDCDYLACGVASGGEAKFWKEVSNELEC
jgi:hypothetical protein